MRGRAKGFTLLESVIAMAVFAVGFLGLVALQVQSQARAHDVYLQQAAAMLAQDLSDRMLVNRNAIGDDGYFSTAQQTLACAGSGDASLCTPNALARHDLFEWQSQLTTQLPNGTYTVCRDASPNDGTASATACDGLAESPAVVKIFWQGKEASLPSRLSVTMILGGGT